MAKERTLKYIGPHVAVDVPALGRTVARGDTVTVDDAALAKALLAQGENWEEVSGKAEKAAGKDSGE